MPVYEYRCKDCGEDFDLFVRSAEQQKTPTCPYCGSEKVKKAVSLFGLSGSGSGSTAGEACGPGPI